MRPGVLKCFGEESRGRVASTEQGREERFKRMMDKATM